MKFEDSFITQTELANWFGIDRTTVRAYHVKGLKHRPGPRKTNEYHCTASVNWITGHRAAVKNKLPLKGVEPLAFSRYLSSLEPHEPDEWVAGATLLGTRMGYTEKECFLAAGKINGLAAAGEIRSNPTDN